MQNSIIKATQGPLVATAWRLLLLAVLARPSAQAAELHIILGTTNPYGADQFEAAIAVVRADRSVEVKKDLFGPRTSKFTGLGWIDTNHEARRVIAIRAGDDEDTGKMVVIDFDTADIAKTCGRVSAPKGLGAANGFLVDHIRNGLVRVTRFSGNQQDSLVGLIVDPKIGCQESVVALDNDAILSYVTDGSAGVGANGANNALSSGFENNSLRNILGQDRFYFPRIPDELLASQPPTSVSLPVRNRKVEVMRLAWTVGGESTFRYLTHNRVRGDWIALPIGEDEFPNLRAFGEWLAWQSSPSEKSLRRKRPGIEPIRPGSSDFPKESSRYGKAAMYGILTPSIYTGILHLYNVNSKADLTLDTKHGDSEILLVSGTTAYYRVYDRLYKAEITTSGFGKPELIAKSDLVRDAHWAFLSGAAPASGK